MSEVLLRMIFSNIGTPPLTVIVHSLCTVQCIGQLCTLSAHMTRSLLLTKSPRVANHSIYVVGSSSLNPASMTICQNLISTTTAFVGMVWMAGKIFSLALCRFEWSEKSFPLLFVGWLPSF